MCNMGLEDNNQVRQTVEIDVDSCEKTKMKDPNSQEGYIAIY